MANDKEGPRAFARFLESIADGEAHVELTDELHALNKSLVARAEESGKAKGKLTLEIEILALHNGTAGVTYKVKTKAPEKRRGASHFWLTDGDNLSAEKPKQPSLPFRDVNKSADARDVPPQKAVTDV